MPRQPLKLVPPSTASSLSLPLQLTKQDALYLHLAKVSSLLGDRLIPSLTFLSLISPTDLTNSLSAESRSNSGSEISSNWSRKRLTFSPSCPAKSSCRHR